MHSMADWYQSDQSHLSRILDVAQDLKALSFLLKATPFSFVIDLACLASRREYLKLEKWLHDKIMENQVKCNLFTCTCKLVNCAKLPTITCFFTVVQTSRRHANILQEPFLKEVALYLKRRCPSLVSPQSKEDPSKMAQLPPETVHDLIQKLQQFSAYVHCPTQTSSRATVLLTNYRSFSFASPELKELIHTMLHNAPTVLKRAPQPLPSVPIPPPAKTVSTPLPGMPPVQAPQVVRPECYISA